jgi:hypothetical protein
MENCAIFSFRGEERDCVIERAKNIEGIIFFDAPLDPRGRIELVIEMAEGCPLLKDSLLPLVEIEDFEW